jgi:hypothetical protein
MTEDGTRRVRRTRGELMTVRLAETTVVAGDARLNDAGTWFGVSGEVQKFAKARVCAPGGVRPCVLRVGGAGRNAHGLSPAEMPGDCITHEHSQLIVCHSLTST